MEHSLRARKRRDEGDSSGETGRKKLRRERRRKNEARRERGTIMRGEEGARDSIRRASLILENETGGGGRAERERGRGRERNERRERRRGR